MAVAVTVSAPAFGRYPSLRSSGASPEAWMEPEIVFDTVPRYLLSLFLTDRPDLLTTVLDVLDDGLEVGKLPSGKVRFSIDGSLSSSVDGAFALAFIVRPVSEPDGGDAHEYGLEASIPRLLKEAVSQKIASLGGGAGPELVRVDPFRGLDDRLFQGKRFSEYRFGLSGESGDLGRLGILGSVVTLFSRRLGDQGLPIAYLYFPDRTAVADGPIAWLRIGVGAPRRSVESLSVDLIANEIASSHGMIFAKYDRILARSDTSDHFNVIGDYRMARQSVAPSIGAAQTIDQLNPVDVVFAEGPARVGYVADMLAGAAGRLLGGSMTVLGGHTLSCWIVPQGEGDHFAAHLKTVKGATQSLEPTRAWCRELYARAPHGGRTEVAYWAAWKCDDGPGVFKRVADEIRAFVTSECGEPADFRFAISRVLADGERCAGKVKFTIPSSCAHSFEPLLPRLKRAIEGGLPLRRTSRTGRRERSWSEESVIVGKREPSEEPWASLLLGS